MRPVLAKVVCDYQAMRGGAPLHLVDVAEMNDAIDVMDENNRRRRQWEKDHA